MTTIRSMLLGALIAALGLAPALRASGPTFWTVATASDFLKGTSDGVFVSLTGFVTAGPALSARLTTAPAQVWSLISAPDGTLWAGTGADGRVIRLRPGQREETVFTSQENNVFALAASGTRVYAATGPDGKVYAIDADGTARPFFDPAEKYIWALAVDGLGRLWVGAGTPAVIYRVDASGTGQVIYKPAAAHVVTIARDPQGRMLAGTESPGRVYRFDASDRPSVVLDAGASELVSMTANADGVIFAASVTRGDDTPGTGEAAAISATLAASTAASTTAGSTGAPATTTRRSTVYRIAVDGTWEDIWSTPDLIYDVSATADGGLLVATGPEGRLYQIDRNRDVSLLTGVDAKEITRFASDPATHRLTAFATANPGRVLSLTTGQPSA